MCAQELKGDEIVEQGEPTSLVRVFPMHGLHKMAYEGFRTRDAHVLEWMATLLSSDYRLGVHSRPEPFGVRLIKQRLRGTHAIPSGILDHGVDVWRIPPIRERRRWWLSSLDHYAWPSDAEGPALIWNPLLPASARAAKLWSRTTHLHFDLLDNWLIHPAFSFMRRTLESTYGDLFARADTVSANSEGTLELAHRYGRTDALLIPNGCDPSRFTASNAARGRTTVGYIGKIGSRLDHELIRNTALGLPEFNFVFAGPILDKRFKRALNDLPNLTLLGDVPYRRVPELLTQFDVGWVPHAVGDGEVGGDAIKIYEYRAAGLPVLATPIAGTRERPMAHVIVENAPQHIEVMRTLVAEEGTRISRRPEVLPERVTWQHKSRQILRAMDLDRCTSR